MRSSKKLLLSTVAAAAAAVFALPAVSVGYSLLGGNQNLGIGGNNYQRDFRVYNNAIDPGANNNNTPDANYPSTFGAVMSVWKAAKAWGSETANSSRNFDFDYQGETTAAGNPDANVVSWLLGGQCSGGTLAYTQTPVTNGWTIKMCEYINWGDGPGSPAFNQYDIQGIAAHELGHALGLDHSGAGCGGGCSNDATMCAFACGSGESARTTETDDRNGLAAIYGTKPGNKLQITSLAGSKAIGQTMVINGNNFPFPGTVSVKFTAGTTQNSGAIPGVVANVSTTSSSQLSVTVPNEALDGNVLVWTPGSSLSNAYPIDVEGVATVPAPTIAFIIPKTVQALKGDTISLVGSNLSLLTEIKVGSTIVSSKGIDIQSDSVLTFEPPIATALSTFPVTVTNSGGTSNSVNLTYVETDPLLMDAPAELYNDTNATFAWGGTPGDLPFLLFNLTGQSATAFGSQLLVTSLIVTLPPLPASGVGQLTAPISGGVAGISIYTQVLTVDPPGTDETTVELSNIVQSTFQ